MHQITVRIRQRWTALLEQCHGSAAACTVQHPVVVAVGPATKCAPWMPFEPLPSIGRTSKRGAENDAGPDDQPRSKLPPIGRQQGGDPEATADGGGDGETAEEHNAATAADAFQGSAQPVAFTIDTAVDYIDSIEWNPQIVDLATRVKAGMQASAASGRLGPNRQVRIGL